MTNSKIKSWKMLLDPVVVVAAAAAAPSAPIFNAGLLRSILEPVINREF